MGLLNIGITGLNAAQAGLVTTSHNISNASVEGYSRQSIVQTTNTPMFTGAGFFGQGTRVETVKRAYNEYLTQQLLGAGTQQASLASYEAQISQINNLLADSSVGLSPALQGFFQAVQDVSANPASIPARQSMISTAESLVSRFQYLDGRLDEIRDGVEQQISSSVTEINSYAGQIADINKRIALAQVGGTSQQANDLLDQRDQLISELNQLVRVSTIPADDGSLSVFVGSGQPLVIGGQASTLAATPYAFDSSRLGISLVAPTGVTVQVPESLLDGGKLGGLLAFRRESLDGAQNQLGLVAVGLAETFNAQHRVGQDLDGNLGGDFFTPPQPTVLAQAGTTTAAPGVQFGNVAELTGDDYTLTFTDAVGGYTLRRNADGVAVLAADVGLVITPPGASVVGDGFTIQPTRAAAGDLALSPQLAGNPRLIAAAAPVISAASLANTGSATLTGLTVNSTTGLPLAGDITLTFDASTNTFSVSGGAPASLSFDPITQANGASFTLTSADVSFTLSGVPANGDTFTLSANAGGVSDNRNAVLLGKLQLGKTMLGGTASYQSVYSSLVAEVGSKTREVQVNGAAQATLLEQATAARDSLSAVNLDEEAANLIRYQQAYQAAARVMSISSTLFDEVLAIGR
ncbi:MAG: flagellar hook-associated protein FlgK [Rhodocyclaceae bacterium]|jgi:flagellar hook-associated protein 1 FlgK|nr:flagellar hook-associated protein FlgK [Rhodocyclaceae bacterium]